MLLISLKVESCTSFPFIFRDLLIGSLLVLTPELLISAFFHICLLSNGIDVWVNCACWDVTCLLLVYFWSSWLFRNLMIFPILQIHLGVKSLILTISSSFGSFEDWIHACSWFASFLTDVGGSVFPDDPNSSTKYRFPFFMILLIIVQNQVVGLNFAIFCFCCLDMHMLPLDLQFVGNHSSRWLIENVLV